MTALVCACRLFPDAQQHIPGTAAQLEDWKPANTSEHYLAMTQQQQAVGSVALRCQCYTGAMVRGMHLRREKEDLRLKTMDSAIAASFYSTAEGQGAALKTSFGIIQEIISIPVKFCSSPQFFLKVRWYDQSLVQEDERIRGVPLTKSSGTSADYEHQDVHVSKETVLMRPGKIVLC